MRSRAVTYAASLVVLVATVVAVGAVAVTLVTRGDPSYPVRVFGRPGRGASAAGVTAIRPQDVPVLTQGRVDSAQLLPLPVVVSDGEVGPPDALRRVLDVLGHERDLDAARVAAQRGRRAESARRYEELVHRLPRVRPLLIEYASVLSSFGEHARAARVLQSSLGRFPEDVELRVLAARHAWWANQPFLADSLLDLAFAADPARLDPATAEASRLRMSVRGSVSPPLPIALRWAREGGPLEQLLLARAFVREQQYGSALEPFRRALRSPELQTDSLLLEAASAAMAADSLATLEALSETYLLRHPGDRATVLRLARAYSWRGEYAAALRHYARVQPVDDSLRFEIAQVVLWSGDQRRAEDALRAVVAAAPAHAGALKLLGDLATWRGQWSDAHGYYARAAAVSPALPGLAQAVADMQRARDRERQALARARAIPEAVDVAVEAYGDNHRFRWAVTRASRSVAAHTTQLRAIAQYSVFEGAPLGGMSRNPGVSGRLEADFDIGSGLRATAFGGAEQYAMVGTFPVYGVALRTSVGAASRVELAYRHEPAVLTVGSLLALQGAASADAFTATVSGASGHWSFWGRAQDAFVRSRFGGTQRVAADATLMRALGLRTQASLGVSALWYDAGAPMVPGAGPMYWAPAQYVEPTAALRYTLPATRHLSITAGARAGYAFVRERQGERRFAAAAIPMGGASLDAAYLWGPWMWGASASYNGAVGPGYRAGTVTARASYRVGR